MRISALFAVAPALLIGLIDHVIDSNSLEVPQRVMPDSGPVNRQSPPAITLPALSLVFPASKIGAVALISFPPLNVQDVKTAPPGPESTKPADEHVPPQRAAIRAILEQEATRAGLPADIAEAVVRVESGYDPNAIGSVGEIGLMQVRPGTAAMLGFRGPESDLAKPEINLHYGVQYLGQAWRLANGDLCRALMKYRAGHGEEIMTPLSVDYCNRARGHLAALGSPLAAIGASSPVTPLFATYDPKPSLNLISPSAVYAKYKRGSAAATKAFWSAQEARVRAIDAKLEAKWRRHVALR